MNSSPKSRVGTIVSYFDASGGVDPVPGIIVKELDDDVVNLVTWNGDGVSIPRLSVPAGKPGHPGRWALLNAKA